jgi:hypothetical protein
MSFADEVKRNSGRGPGSVCAVATALLQLNDGLRAEVVAVISSPAYTSSAIVKALKAHGVDIAEQSMSRHRREACRCSRTT